MRNTMHNVSHRATPSPDRAAHAHQTPHNGLHDRALRDGCVFATCNVQHANTRRCNANHAPMHYATCDTHRCTARRAPVQHAPRKHATCNAHRCNAERAPMQHASMRHVDATNKAMYCSDAMRADATRSARRCNTQRAPMQHALGARTPAVLFAILPPLNVTAPSSMRTTPPSSYAQAGAATPIAIGRRTPSADTRPNRASPH